MVTSLSKFRQRRTLELYQEARVSLFRTRSFPGRDDSALQKVWADRIERVGGALARKRFDNEWKARRMLGEARRGFLNWRYSDDPQVARADALRKWNEARSLLAGALCVDEVEIALRDGV